MSEAVRVNLMVVEFAQVDSNTGMKHWVEPCDTLSEDDARKQWEVDTNAGDRIVAMCEVILRDEAVHSLQYPYAKTYEALMALNDLSDEPRVQDLLTRIFALGFAAGQDAKSKELRKALGVS